MYKRSLLRCLALGIMGVVFVTTSTAARAGTVLVQSDSGGGTVDVRGTAAGANITNFNTQLTEINGNSVTLPLSLTTLHITDSGGVFGGSGTKTIGSLGNEAVLTFTITDGSVSNHFFDLSGVITGVTSPGTVHVGTTTYNFSDLVPGGLITLGMSTTTGNFAAAMNHPGRNVLHSGFELVQSASVPEPASLALLGIGITGFLAFRRYFKKTSILDAEAKRDFRRSRLT